MIRCHKGPRFQCAAQPGAAHGQSALVYKMKTAAVIATVVALIVGSLGCGSNVPTYPKPVERPLTKAEEAFLKELEAVPQAGRRQFVTEHRDQVMNFARGNKTFGERLNADLAKPQTK